MVGEYLEWLDSKRLYGRQNVHLMWETQGGGRPLRLNMMLVQIPLSSHVLSKTPSSHVLRPPTHQLPYTFYSPQTNPERDQIEFISSHLLMICDVCLLRTHIQ